LKRQRACLIEDKYDINTKRQSSPARDRLPSVQRTTHEGVCIYMNILDNTIKSQGIAAFGAVTSDSLESRLQCVRSGSIRTLFALSEFSEGRVKTNDIAEKIQQHRSTTNTHLLELEEVGIVSKVIEVGTENRTKPTYLYSIDSSVDLNQLKNLFNSLFPQGLATDAPRRHSTLQEEGANTSNQVSPELQIPELDLDSLRPNSIPPATQINVPEPQSLPKQSQKSSSQQLQNLLNDIAKEIVSLKSRVADLESQLSIQSSQDSTLDLSQAIQLLGLAEEGGQYE
jgi:predicted transcriptional regulator